jgi:hypothetical protein
MPSRVAALRGRLFLVEGGSFRGFAGLPPFLLLALPPGTPSG